MKPHQSHSSHSDRSRSDHSDDDYDDGVPLGDDSLSASSQVPDADDFVHVNYRPNVRHVRPEQVRERVRRQSRPAYDEADDIDPSDSASRPPTSRHSSTHRPPVDFRGESRRRNPAPDPPRSERAGPHRPPPREAARDLPHRPESFHSESLDHDDYPGYPGGFPYRPGPPGWGHVPHYGGAYAEPSMLSMPMGPPMPGPHVPGPMPPGRERYGDIMAYRDPLFDEPNPFAARGPIDDFYEPRHRPPPRNRRSMGPADYGAMMRFPVPRDPYGYEQFYWPPRPPQPPPPEMREASPPQPQPSKAGTPAPPTPAAPSPGDQRLEKLEALILQQTEETRLARQAKEAHRIEEERKKKQAEEKTQAEKLIALEKLLLKQNEEAIAREKAMEKKQAAAEASAAARLAKEAAEKAAKDKIDSELKAAANAAKEAAEANAAAKAKEAKEAADKELAAMKEKHEAAEAAKKKAEEERDGLKPTQPDPPVRFKDAVGRRFNFPFEACKTWAGMEKLIKQAFLHVDLLGPHVMDGHYDLQGPDGEIILPQVWDTMIKPDIEIEMKMWPIPELEPKKPAEEALPSLEQLLPGFLDAGPSRGRSRRHRGRRNAAVPVPPPPPTGGIPPPPTHLPSPLEVLEMANKHEPKSKKKSKEPSGLLSWMVGAQGKRK